jgi:hypothetical protein
MLAASKPHRHSQRGVPDTNGARAVTGTRLRHYAGGVMGDALQKGIIASFVLDLIGSGREHSMLTVLSTTFAIR